MPARWSASCSGSSTWSPNSPSGPNRSSSISPPPPLPLFRQHLGAIVSAALSAVDARRVTEGALWDLRDDIRRHPIRLVAAGKASPGMAAAAVGVLGTRIVDGVIVAPAGAPSHDDVDLAPHRVVTAGHPAPDAGSEDAGRYALALADANAADDGTLLLCLSGGASSLMAVPAAGLTLEAKRRTTTALLGAGATIAQLNLVRQQLSAIKGGQLAVRARRSVTLAISDVCVPEDDDPAVIGSGPTAGGRGTAAEALDVLRSLDVLEEVPEAVRSHLQTAASRGDTGGPVPAGDPRLRAASYWVIASRHDAMRAAAATAARLGYAVEVRREAVVGSASAAGRAIVEGTAGPPRPACRISSGETTVVVRGPGRGGRNQELAVAALEGLAGLAPAALASVGTDGMDGASEAAGAFVDSSMWKSLGTEARAICHDVLARNDSWTLLDRLGATVTTGPTGTNVGDLQVLLLL